MKLFKHVLRLTILGIMLCIVPIILLNVIEMIYKPPIKESLFGDMYIEHIREAPLGKLLHDDVSIATIDRNSKWIINRPYLYGVFSEKSDSLYIIYKCDTNEIQYFHSVADYTNKLKFLKLNNFDLTTGEGIHEFDNGRKFFSRCNEYN